MRSSGSPPSLASRLYERLAAEGFLTGRVGSGSFVTGSAVVPARRNAASAPANPAPTGVDVDLAAVRPRDGWTYTPRWTRGSQPVPRYDFRVGAPDRQLFPFDTWRRLIGAQWRLAADNPAGYAEPAGYLALRQAIVRYVGCARSVRAEPDDVVVTNGAQQALDLVARVLVTPGDVVAMEEPGYPPARDVFASAGARVVGVPVDGDGLVVERLPVTARLVYTTPSHQLPLGTPMSLSRRVALLAWADEHHAAVIEDDYDSEFRFAARPLEPLHSLDTSGRVLYVGTFSKTLLPDLRIGYVVVPPTLRSAVRAAKQLSDGHAPVATQAALARFMDEGLLARHIRKASRVYAARRAAILDAIERDLAEHLDPVPSVAGLHVCLQLRSGEVGTAGAVAAAARADGVAVGSLGDYFLDSPAEAGFVLGYGAIRSDDVRPGLDRFAAILRRHARR